MNRDASLNRLSTADAPFDIAVIGGGATGAGIALDAASRGASVALLERGDFGAGTSSKSTKIIHGGVRYLAQGRIGLVREALRERALLLKNAPHTVQPLAFVVPIANFRERVKYRAGLALYDALAGRRGIDLSAWLSRAALHDRVPGLADADFTGGVRYFDAQFDDTRLLIDILATADAHGACSLNYADVVHLDRNGQGRIHALGFRDLETNAVHEIEARCVINATGAAGDALLALDGAPNNAQITPSQGAHIVVDPSFLPGGTAVLMPHTPDGRVMFAIPWLGHVLLGTTDTAVPVANLDPTPREDEIDMILNVAARYLARAPQRGDILSTFAGLRPLASAPADSATANVSREHRIDVSASGLVSICGGKWTTYRAMAAECVDIAARHHRLPLAPSATAALPLHRPSLDDTGATLIAGMPYTEADCERAVRDEMARSIEDVLARRTRALFLNAGAALTAAPTVLRILRREFGWSDARCVEEQARFDVRCEHYRYALKD